MIFVRQGSFKSGKLPATPLPQGGVSCPCLCPSSVKKLSMLFIYRNTSVGEGLGFDYMYKVLRMRAEALVTQSLSVLMC